MLGGGEKALLVFFCKTCRNLDISMFEIHELLVQQQIFSLECFHRDFITRFKFYCSVKAIPKSCLKPRSIIFLENLRWFASA